MEKELRLKRPGKMSMRINIVLFVVLLLVSAAIGFTLNQTGITGLVVGKSACIPQKDFQYFLDKTNTLQADYQKCVSDLWSLQFSYKVQMNDLTAKQQNTSNVTK